MRRRRKQPEEIKPQVAIKKPPVRFAETQALLSQLTNKMGHPVISYWNSSDGSICSNDVVALNTLLQEVGSVGKIGLFVKSGGGNGESSLRMVHLLRQHAENIDIYIPLEASSAATMLSLGGNRIYMGPMAQLSAVDTSLGHALSPLDRDNNRVRVSQDEVERLLRLWRETDGAGGTRNPFTELYQHIHPLVIGAVDRVSALSTRICSEILSYHMEEQDRIEQISHTLNSEYPSHSYPITMREAQRIGIQAEPIDDEILKLLLALNDEYSAMGQAASTDIDENNSHDESILNILEVPGKQIFFQNQKDWFYRENERRWVVMNNRSSWKSVSGDLEKPKIEQFYIS